MSADASHILLKRSSIEEKNGRAFLSSIGIHVLAVLLIVLGGSLFPDKAILISSGPGGGTGGDIPTVGVVDELSGGDASMTKPSLTQKPPELKDEVKPINKEKAIPLPKTIEPVKKRPEVKPAKNAKPVPDSNVIPTRGEAGSGGAGGRSGGAGGGFGGGHGVSIGIGSGGPSGFGDSLYARQIEDRIGQNWQKPAPGARFEITYSFFVEADGRISEIQKEKSSGNQFYDIAAESAIRSCNPFNPPNGQYRGMRLKFVAKFVYPPN